MRERYGIPDPSVDEAIKASWQSLASLPARSVVFDPVLRLFRLYVVRTLWLNLWPLKILGGYSTVSRLGMHLQWWRARRSNSVKCR